MHLLLALSLIALTVWTLAAMQQPQSYRIHWNGAARGVVVALVILALQIIYGGMTAGLKAGYLSDTWPLMFGVLVPAGLFSFVQPAWLNLLEAPVTVLFVHRWLPFVGLALLPLLWRAVRQHVGYGPYTSRLLWGLVGLVLLQITLGILVLVTHVSLPVALIHQVGAVALLVVLMRMLQHTLTAGSTLSTPVENSVDYVPLHSSI
jgi:cytochrome c oxidase assembly protein subunit 15